MRRPWILPLLALLALAVNGAIAAAATTRVPAVSAAIYAGSALVCHQRPERSFHVDGVQLPVCARCLGLYAGGALGILGLALTASSRGSRARLAGPSHLHAIRTLLLVVAAPTALTVATAWTGLWDPGNLTRALLAVPLGAVGGMLVAATASGELS